MVVAECHCGAVGMELASPPLEVTECNCSICRRYGALWAYYPAAMVSVSGATHEYSWDDRSIAFHRCRACGCITHWSALDPGRDRVGVNARLLDPHLLSSATVRHLDGAGSEEYLD